MGYRIGYLALSDFRKILQKSTLILLNRGFSDGWRISCIQVGSFGGETD